MVYRELPPRSAHAGHNFIGNQQNFLALANLRDLLQISLRRHDRTQGGAADRFKNHGGCFVIGIGNGLLDLGCVFLAAVEAAIRAVVGAAVAIRRTHGHKLAQHGPVDFATALIPRNCYRPQRRSVVTLLAADNLRSLTLASLHLTLARQLYRSFSRLRPSTAEVNRALAKILSREIQ